MLYLEAGGAHGDAHIRQQGAEVFPFERPGPAFDQDVPSAHGAQHGAAHLDGDKGGAPLLFGHTDEQNHILLWTLSFQPLQLLRSVGRILITSSFLTSKLILAVNGSSSSSSKPSSILNDCGSYGYQLRTNKQSNVQHTLQRQLLYWHTGFL